MKTKENKPVQHESTIQTRIVIGVLLVVGGLFVISWIVGFGVFSFMQAPANNQTTNNSIQELAKLPVIESTQLLELKDKQRISLSANVIQRELNGQKIEWFGYNNQSPGPVLKVQQGSSLWVDFTNNLNEPTTMHWHGLRLENKYDGVPEVTQAEVKPGAKFEYKLDFPDEGLFWYHPHVREDKQQEMGLYGTILVEPKNKPSTSVLQEEILVLDDVTLSDKGLAEFDSKTTNFAVMGRYGNTFLVNGKTDFKLVAAQTKPLRLYLLNAANARPFRFAIEKTRLKIVGGDAGLYEKPFFADSVTISPSERAIVEIYPEQTGEFALQNVTPLETKRLGTLQVMNGTANFVSKQEFETITENQIAAEEIKKLEPYFNREPDFEYELLIRWPVMDRMVQRMGGTNHTIHSTSDGIEWEDEMEGVNEITTNEEVTWVIRDAATKKENMDFSHSVKKGQIKKIRLKNLETSSHPMQHEIHLHGNRFLVLSEDGIPNPHLVWKDSVLIPRGKTIDLLVEFSNSGDWMLHCHTAEHLSSGMMSLIKVE